MAILKLNCHHCHTDFMVDEEVVSWKTTKTTDDWLQHIDYQEAICPKCNYPLHFNHIAKICDDLD